MATEKIKCYTMSMGMDSKLIDPNIDNILETLRVELEENCTEEDPLSYDFGVEYMTQEELDNLGEFDGF
ncbi:hypothetical protein PFY12_14625 [Chryseobacterium camelliae]|uniref:Uncharacterized protein n=1 Tax=Chryseobacterium camelliae TaxID=1265445 RepID=A0ABY7QKT9_9FLAO|nr:hypothetical protein [Chryseobacterium camelliae]WBV60260.1 hypothetical protein PFY12_14625 [Chryseobacterium camelliae]